VRNPLEELQELKNQALLRTLKPQSNDLLNFSSNDYLGLSQHPTLIQAAQAATQKYGTGSTASRLVCGNSPIHQKLENELAQLKKSDAALTFANGYTAALGTLTALTRPGDTIIIDKLAHACLIDGARLAQTQNKVTLRIFPHNDLNKLEKLLKATRQKSPADARIIIATESIFSMDGDTCPLPEIVALKEKHGALLLLDEAHGTGTLGSTGLGLAQHYGLQEKIDLQMGTLGKSLGSAGGYITASRPLIDLLINKARSLIYSTAPPPAQAAASLAALQLLQKKEGQSLIQKLQQNITTIHEKTTTQKPPLPTPIIPLILGSNEAALSASAWLLEQKIFIPAIRYPTVPKGTARLRLTLSAAHTNDELLKLADALSQLPEIQTRQL